MELKDIIIKYRTDHNLSQRQFAKKCEGITNGYLSMIEADYNPHTKKPPRPSVEKLTAIAHGMGITYERLNDMLNDRPAKFQYAPEPEHMSAEILSILDNAIPYTPGRAMVPIIGTVRCGPGGLAFEELQGAEMADVANPSEYFYLRATGDSMAPAIEPGDLALVHIQPQVDNGQLAVVIIGGEEGTLKKFIRNGSAVILQSMNTAYPPRVFVGDEINTLTVAGRVVETKRKW